MNEVELVLVFCRSDLGSQVGFEATGLVDGRLPTVGVWTKKTDEVRISSLITSSP